MESIKERLERGVSILEGLERKRRKTNLPLFGCDVECLIVTQELREIENDIFRDPGPLERWLVRARDKINPDRRP
jgi:hypothetical protein